MRIVQEITNRLTNGIRICQKTIFPCLRHNEVLRGIQHDIHHSMLRVNNAAPTHILEQLFQEKYRGFNLLTSAHRFRRAQAHLSAWRFNQTREIFYERSLLRMHMNEIEQNQLQSAHLLRIRDSIEIEFLQHCKQNTRMRQGNLRCLQQKQQESNEKIFRFSEINIETLNIRNRLGRTHRK